MHKAMSFFLYFDCCLNFFDIGRLVDFHLVQIEHLLMLDHMENLYLV